jgi:hypothetical protein
LLVASNIEGLTKTGCCLPFVRDALPEQQLSLEPMQFSLVKTLPSFLHRRQQFGQYA